MKERGPTFEVTTASGIEEMDINLKDVLPGLFGGRTRKRKMRVGEAMDYLVQEEEQKLVDMDQVTRIAIERVERSGIIFLDEIDKIAGREGGHGPDVSREGVQRDILPIVEGTTVNTRYGFVRTDHILFIAAGAFHVSKPSDLIPELQGRFPIRVELKSLTEADFIRILKEPKNALIKQYQALLDTEGIKLTFTEDALEEIAAFAARVNESTENIGARRLHTILEKLLEEVSFDGPDLKKKNVKVDAGLRAQATGRHRQGSGPEPVHSVIRAVALLWRFCAAPAARYVGPPKPPALDIPDAHHRFSRRRVWRQNRSRVHHRHGHYRRPAAHEVKAFDARVATGIDNADCPIAGEDTGSRSTDDVPGARLDGQRQSC